MSGEKCTNTRTSRSTVKNARNNSSNQTARNTAIQNAVNQANREANNRINNIQTQNRNREGTLRKTISGLNSNLKKAEQKRLQDLNNQNRSFESRIQRQGQRVQAQIVNEQKARRNELQQTKRQLETNIKNAVGAERVRTQRKLNRIDNKISTLDKSLRKEIRRVDKGLRKQMKKQKEFLEKRMDNLVGEEREARKREVARIDQNIEILDQAIQGVDAKLDSEISRVETNFKDMLDIEAEQRRIDIKSLQDWTASNLSSQRKEYLNITDQQKQEIEINRQAINEILEKIGNNTDAATEYISDLNKIIQEGYESRKKDFDKYAPGEINKTIRRANRATEQVNNKMEQTGMAEAINSYEDWLTINEKVEQKKNEFQFWHTETVKDALALFEIIRKNREEGHHMIGEKEVEVQGEMKEVLYDAEVELDHWTNGKFSQLEKEVADELTKLDQGEELTLEEVKNISNKIKNLQEQEADIIEEAELKVIASELRAEMADLIVETLEDNGFAILEDNTGYDRKDARRAFIVNMKNNGGADVVISIVPKEESHENVLIIQTRNEINYSEAQTQEIVSNVLSILSEEGIHIGDVQCRNNHMEEFYDFEKIFNENGGLPENELIERGGSVK